MTWLPEDPRSVPPPFPPGPRWRGGQPVIVHTASERKRFRLGVLLRTGLLSPHFAFLELWWVPAQFALIAAWFSALFTGRVSFEVHQFLARLVRYQTRVAAYALLLADPFPGFTTQTSYPFDLELAAPRRHSRVRTVFYLPIAGMLLVGVAFATLALMFMWPLGWLWCLIAGRTPRWYQRAATWLVVFVAQSMAFGVLVTDRLPSRSRDVSEDMPWEPTPLPPARAGEPGPKGIGRVLSFAGVLGLAVVAVITGVLLWHTTVPTDLQLPHLKASNYFDEFQLSDIGAENTADRWFLIGQLASILALVLFAWRGARLVRHSAAGPIGSGIFLGTLGVGLAALASAPFLVLGLSALPEGVDTGPIGLDVPLQVLGSMSSVAIVVVAGMGIARKLPNRWWLITPFLLGALLATTTIALAPALAGGGHKLKDRVLLADARELAAREGIPHKHIDIIDERDSPTDTPTPTNAFAAGGGRSSEVVLLGSLRSRRELRVILGHEIAHIARNHVRRSLVWQLLFLLLASAAVRLAIRRRGDLYNPAVIPLALLVFSFAHLVWTPVDTGASRRYEAEADWIALNATQDPKGDIALMRDLAADNDAAPTRPWWATAMLEDHPDIMKRIEMAVAWERRHPRG